MYAFPIGMTVNPSRVDRSTAIKEAVAIGVQGIQMHTTFGENAPEALNTAARKALLDEVKGEGLIFSALCGDLRKGFANRELNPALIEKSKRIVDLALDLETTIVSTHIGHIPTDKTMDRYKIMQEAYYEIASYAGSVGAHFAVETGPENSLVLKEFLDALNCAGVSVNMDPANLLMITGEDPVEAVYNLRKYIVHTHAKDGNRLVEADPEYIYGVKQPMPPELQGKPLFEEVPMGTGSVDFPAYLKALEDIGYKGFLTIEWEVIDNREAEIGAAYQFLKKTLAENA